MFYCGGERGARKIRKPKPKRKVTTITEMENKTASGKISNKSNSFVENFDVDDKIFHY